MKESQEDCYWRTKKEFEKGLGIEISIDTWNNLFFKTIDPYREAVIVLQNKLEAIQKALKIVKEFTNG
jgi:hypothetical protein